jgi:hypothetical protein
MVDSVRGSTTRVPLNTTTVDTTTPVATTTDPAVTTPTVLKDGLEKGEGGTKPQQFANGTTGHTDARTAAKRQTAPKPQPTVAQKLKADATAVGHVATTVAKKTADGLGHLDTPGGANMVRKVADAGLDLIGHTAKATKSEVLTNLGKANATGLLQKGVSAANLATNAYATATNLKPTYQSIKQAVKDPTTKNVLNAVNASANELKSAIFTGKGALSTAKNVSEAVIKRLATSSTGEHIVEAAVTKGVALRGAEAVAEVAGKTLGRLTPGLSVAIAALDAAKAVHDLHDPSVSKGRKICSCITAAGSALAALGATSVIGEPLAAVGAGIAVVSGFIGSFFK